MNFWNLNENEKPKNTAHSVGLEFGPRPSIVGPAQWLFWPSRSGHSTRAWRTESVHCEAGYPPGKVAWTGAHWSGGSTMWGRWQWVAAFWGDKEAPVADGGGGRHLQHQRNKGKVRGKAIWSKKTWRRCSPRTMVSGGGGCDAPAVP
jgi:hypothetical protein